MVACFPNYGKRMRQERRGTFAAHYWLGLKSAQLGRWIARRGLANSWCIYSGPIGQKGTRPEVHLGNGPDVSACQLSRA